MKSTKELRAVLTILKSQPGFFERFQHGIDIQKETIHWEMVIKCASGCSGSEYARLAWAYGFWNNETHTKLDVFSLSQSLDDKNRKAVVRALAIFLEVEEVLNEKS